MIAVAAVIAVLGLAVISDYSGDVDIGYGVPLIVDLVGWYVVGAHLGVFPALA